MRDKETMRTLKSHIKKERKGIRNSEGNENGVERRVETSRLIVVLGKEKPINPINYLCLGKAVQKGSVDKRGVQKA